MISLIPITPRRFKMRRFGGLVMIYLVLGLSALSFRVSAQEVPALSQVLEVRDHGLKVWYPDDWSLLPDQSGDSYIMVDVAADLQDEEPAESTIEIAVDPRPDHSDALQELSQIAAGVGASPDDFFAIGGWPALQTRRVETRPQPDRGPQFADPMVLRINTWIAAGSLLIYVYAQLPSDADELLIAEAEEIAASVTTSSIADREQTGEDVEQLRHEMMSPRNEDPAFEEDSGIFEEHSNGFPAPQGTAPQTPPSTFNQRIVTTGFGEVEIAASPNGQNIVIGQNNNNWVASNDGGNTFPNTGNIGAFDGDPSLAFAISGAFYYAGIDTNCESSGYVNPFPAGQFDCIGIAQSPIAGQPFLTSTTNPAVVCPRVGTNRCLPDQEHIAADRVNAGVGGGDQVYATWRHFLVAPQTEQFARLVCTQDNGVNWINQRVLTGGFFPRIAVGADGFVYVVARSTSTIVTNDRAGVNTIYRLWKFSSCANGLVQQFRVGVFDGRSVDCPFAGHDRCDANPSNQTVAVDDTNPNHIYFAVARGDGTPNRDATIFVSDSINGGRNWRRPVRAHAAIPAPRIMPWLCATGGDAYVTWFDRRAAPPCPRGNCPGVRNDATDFFAGRVGLDDEGNLVPLGEFKISEVPHPWCGPINTPWPQPTRQARNPRPGASEACSLQPQLGGQCCQDNDRNGFCDTGTASGTACDVSRDNPGLICSMGQVCLGGGGQPRYGDYNGNACAAGRLFAAWPSGTSPSGEPPASPGAEGILFDAFLVGAVPVVSTPREVDFGNVSGAGPFRAPLEICNTGNENLLVEEITPSNPNQFSVRSPNSGFPVQISPDFCFPFVINFTPQSSGPISGVLAILTNDPATPGVPVVLRANRTGPVIP